MLKRTLLLTVIATGAHAIESPIVGNVQSACSIYTTTEGVYGTASIDELSTSPTAGGVKPIIRIDTTQAGSYIGKVTTPTAFSSSPTLNDALNWTGDVTVNQVSDPLMADYDTDKTTYDQTHVYDLTVSGSVWLEIDSSVTYGVGKALPGGQYVAKVMAECIPK
jgi:hypothetical protein